MIRSQLHLIGQPVRCLQTMLRTISFAYTFLYALTRHICVRWVPCP